MQDVAIKVDRVSKSFKLPNERNSSLKSAIVNFWRQKRGYSTQHVLKDVSFEIQKGEFFGIVGRNGSGKSTLLKIISDIYKPNKGSVKIDGKLTPFIELGVGFNPELTGRENVYLNGALLGFSRKEIDGIYDEIVEFAELEKFMDQKLKNYSSGMQVRLAFSVAIQAKSDILVLDEVLAVGDEAFQRKCNDFFEKIKKDKTKTVVLVTHSMDSVRKYCSRAMLIQDGIIKAIGNTDEIADQYYEINIEPAAKKHVKQDKNRPSVSAKVMGKHLLTPDDTLEIEITYKAVDKNPVFAKAYIESAGQPIMATNSGLLGWDHMITADTKQHTAIYSLPLRAFNKGEYKVVALLEDVDTKANVASFGYDGEVVVKINNPDKSSSGGLMQNQATMTLRK